MSPKVPLPGPTFNAWFLEPTRLSPPNGIPSVQLFLHSSLVCPRHRQTDTQTTLRAISVAIYRVQAMRPEIVDTTIFARTQRHERPIVTGPTNGPVLFCSLSSVVCRRLSRCQRAGCRARERSGGQHCTAGQYGYVPLGRYLVLIAATERCGVCGAVTGRHCEAVRIPSLADRVRPSGCRWI